MIRNRTYKKQGVRSAWMGVDARHIITATPLNHNMQDSHEQKQLLGCII